MTQSYQNFIFGILGRYLLNVWTDVVSIVIIVDNDTFSTMITHTTRVPLFSGYTVKWKNMENV